MIAAGLAVLRVTVAVVFAIHGAHVLFGFWGGPGPGPGGLASTAARFDAAGLSPGYLLAVLAGLIQLAGGLLLLVGWLTRWVSAALILFLAITGWKMHALWGFFLNWTGEPTRGHGVEFAVVLAGALTCLVISGSGDWSIEGWRADRAAMRAAAGRARLRR